MLGVLGGMGPMATVDFLRKLVEATPAEQDADHLPVFAGFFPQIPDRTAAIQDGGESPLPAMLLGAQTLKNAGVELAVMPCNTAHHWYEELAQHSELNFLHIADAVCEVLQDRDQDVQTVGILATPGTIQSGFYQTRLKNLGYDCRVPEGDAAQHIYTGIQAVKAGNLEAARNLFMPEVEKLQQENVQVLILGCTELPVVLTDDTIFVDSNQALAKVAVREYTQRCTKN